MVMEMKMMSDRMETQKPDYVVLGTKAVAE